MNKRKMYKIYQVQALVLFVLAGGIYGLNAIWLDHDFFDGLALGIFILSLVLGGFLFLKRKDEDFKEDLEFQDQDERLKSMRTRRHSIMHRVLLNALLVMVTISVFYDFSFKLGAGILMYIEIVGFGILWLFDRRK